MSQGFAGLGWNKSKMPKSPPIVQLHLAKHRLCLTIPLHKTKTGTGHWLQPKLVSWTQIFQLQMISFYWGEGTSWPKEDEKDGFNRQSLSSTAPPGSQCLGTIHSWMWPQWHLREDTAQGCDLCQGQSRLWGKGAFHSWPMAQLSQLPAQCSFLMQRRYSWTGAGSYLGRFILLHF